MTVDKTSGEVGHASVVETAVNGVSVDIGRPYYRGDRRSVLVDRPAVGIFGASIWLIKLAH